MGLRLRILFVEDDADYREALCHIFNLEGFSADGVGSVAAYLAWRATHAYDVLIVDRQLPDGDGLEVLRVHRQLGDSPAIVLTARGKIPDRVAGLEADADYYLVKPVAMDELIALIKRLQRRLDSGAGGPWAVDPSTWRLRCPNGVEIALTRRELALLLLFTGRQGQPVARQDIAVGLGEDPALFDPRRLEILVRRLRHKVEEAAAKELPLITVYGVGYAFNQPLLRA